MDGSLKRPLKGVCDEQNPGSVLETCMSNVDIYSETTERYVQYGKWDVT